MHPGTPLRNSISGLPRRPINYHLGVDGISMFLVILTTFLTPICVLASWKGVHHRLKEFHVMLLLLEVGVIGVFFSLDLFLFFLFWEIMLIPMAFLIGIWGHDRRHVRCNEVRALHDGRLDPDAGGNHLAL